MGQPLLPSRAPHDLEDMGEKPEDIGGEGRGEGTPSVQSGKTSSLRVQFFYVCDCFSPQFLSHCSVRNFNKLADSPK